MTGIAPSTEQRPRDDSDIPGMPSALWRSLRFAYRAEPRLLVVSFATVTGAWIPDALAALWLGLLANGILHKRNGLIVGAVVGLAVSTTAGWLLRIVGNRLEFIFRERATIAIEAHVTRLQASVATIEHHERPEFLDRLQILKDHVFLLNHLYPALMSSFGAVARVLITVGILVSIHPALVALVLFALPTMFASSWRAGVERKVEEKAAPRRRLAKHFFDLGTMAGHGKEVRVWRLGSRVVDWRRQAWDEWFIQTSAARKASAVWHTLAWALFGAAYVGGIVFVASVLHASPAQVIIVVVAGSQLSRYLGMTASQADFLRWCLEAAQRLAWLEDFVASRAVGGDVSAPQRIEHGIRLEGVSFRYPGTEAWVLRDVDLEFPAGAVVAVVGENGAGKTTLVKLLSRFYEPTTGRIMVDDVELGRIRPEEWRERLAGAYQDFMRFEFVAGHTIGLGELGRMDDVPAVCTAVTRAGADDVIAKLPLGLETQLGPTWDNGKELSFGQWQKLALARGFMRDRPLLLALDEPTAALDAETEHALFERFAAASRESSNDGRVTILVSHRFSTVRMADLIVVIDDGRVVEFGPHEALLERNGLYAELYGIQANAYR